VSNRSNNGAAVFRIPNIRPSVERSGRRTLSRVWTIFEPSHFVYVYARSQFVYAPCLIFAAYYSNGSVRWCPRCVRYWGGIGGEEELRCVIRRDAHCVVRVAPPCGISDNRMHARSSMATATRPIVLRRASAQTSTCRSLNNRKSGHRPSYSFAYWAARRKHVMHHTRNTPSMGGTYIGEVGRRGNQLNV
jgi:hypothetical protein